MSGVPLLPAAIFVGTGVISTVVAQIILYAGAGEGWTALLPLANYAGMTLAAFVPTTCTGRQSHSSSGAHFRGKTSHKDSRDEGECAHLDADGTGDGRARRRYFHSSSGGTGGTHTDIESPSPAASPTSHTHDASLSHTPTFSGGSSKRGSSNTRPCCRLTTGRFVVFTIALDCIGYLLSVFGMRYAGSALFQVLYSSVVVWAALGSWLFRGKLLNRVQIGGIVLVMLGLALSGLREQRASSGGTSSGSNVGVKGGLGSSWSSAISHWVLPHHHEAALAENTPPSSDSGNSAAAAAATAEAAIAAGGGGRVLAPRQLAANINSNSINNGTDKGNAPRPSSVLLGMGLSIACAMTYGAVYVLAEAVTAPSATSVKSASAARRRSRRLQLQQPHSASQNSPGRAFAVSRAGATAAATATGAMTVVTAASDSSDSCCSDDGGSSGSGGAVALTPSLALLNGAGAPSPTSPAPSAVVSSSATALSAASALAPRGETRHPSPAQLASRIGGGISALLSVYVALWVWPRRAVIVAAMSSPAVAIPLSWPAILALYCVIALSSTAHSLSYFNLMGSTGSVTTGLMSSLRAVGVFIVSGPLFCSLQEAQCITSGRAAAAVCVLSGVLLYSTGTQKAKSGGGGGGPTSTLNGASARMAAKGGVEGAGGGGGLGLSLSKIEA